MKRLTPDQKRILLVACDAAERNAAITLIVTTGPNPIRETTTAAALIRKGLLCHRGGKRYEATTTGFWLGDALRIEDRLGRIPPRRTP